MNISSLSKIILDYGEKNDFITGDDILSFIKKCYPNFNCSYKNIIIAMLMNEKIIYAYDLNVYKTFKKRIEFIPYQNKALESQLEKFIKDKNIIISYFNSSFYNSLSSLQSINNYLFLGVESYAVNYLVNQIEKNNKKVVLSNDLAKLRKLLSDLNHNFDYVVKTINVDTPLFKKKSNVFYYPKIETLLVDLLSDKTLRDLYSSEIENIYLNALNEYAIKINTLLRYANKKGIKQKIISLLEYINFDIKRGEFNYD